MDPLSYPIFLFISNIIRHEFNLVMDQAYLNFTSTVVHIVAAVEVIYIMNFGYSIMFGKAINASIGTPSIEKLLYHLVFTGFIIGLISHDKTPLDVLFALRGLLLEGLTHSSQPAGEQAANGLSAMNTAFALNTALSSLMYTDPPSALNITNLNLSLMTQVSPQITAAIMLLINEMMVRIGMALCPLMLYAAVYVGTRFIFNRWLMYMVGLSIQMGILAITTHIAAKVTTVFLSIMTTLTLSNDENYFISELQQSFMQAGFGMSLTLLLLWFPSNAGSFGGTKLYEKTTKSSLGTFDTLSHKVYKS